MEPTMDKRHLIMERSASDNKYLHRDFHVTADIGLSYVGEHFGDTGVREYLTRYAKSFYKNLAEEVRAGGILQIKDYIYKIFAAEEREDYVSFDFDGETLLVKIKKCPAIEAMRELSHTPSRWYGETTKTVYPVLAEMSEIGFELISYDEETGAAEFKFFEERRA